ncbi:restriction endonuclease subunit S [Acinetobacter baumannii]|uniref:restriction endonuclease subunit S n=1 Tax=Acinetobacter baumannii TaxID=470 RepID=UPI003891882D
MSFETIKDIVDFNPSRPLSKGKEFPFIDMASLPVNGRDINEVSNKVFNGGGAKFKNGDTLFARITPCLENGKTAKVENLPVGCIAHGSTEFIVLSAKSKDDEDFVYYLARLPDFRSYAISRMEGTSGRQRVSWQALAEFNLRLPEKGKRKKIGKILKSLDDKIHLNNQINQTLESIAQAIFKSWFIDFDPVRATIAAKQEGKDPELAAMCAISGKNEEELQQMTEDDLAELRATASLFPDELVESELGEVPKGWDYKKLKDLCRVINGRAYKNTEFKEEGIPIVRIQNLTGGGKTVFSDLDLPQDKLIEKEDFIYAWSATFGPYIWRGPKSIYHYHIWKMDVDETIISRYFLYLTMFRKTESMKSSGTGSIFTHLTKAIMESQDVLIADNAINMLFKDRIDRIFKLISLKSDEINNLENIRDTLLPKLLSGEIDVSDLGSETEYEYSTK